MPIYRYECTEHGIFEKVKLANFNKSCPCPECGEDSPLVISHIAVVKVVHTERPPWYARERVEDRQRLIKDTMVQNQLKKYKEEMRDMVERVPVVGGDL